MKIARLAILCVAVGAGLLAARLVIGAGPVAEPQPTAEAPAVATDEVLVAAKDIKLGSQISAGDISWMAWPKGAAPAGAILRSNRASAADEMIGRIAKAPVYAGEPIREERLISTDRGFMAAILPKGKRAIAVPVEAVTTAGGFILPGDKVDLILTRQISGSGSNSVTSDTILQN